MQTLKYSCDSLPLAKTLTYQNVIILIKSVFNKDKNNYHLKYSQNNVHINKIHRLYLLVNSITDVL